MYMSIFDEVMKLYFVTDFLWSIRYIVQCKIIVNMIVLGLKTGIIIR